MKHIILIFSYILCLTTASAQRVSYNLNKTNGLPSNKVYSSLVDHNGYLWLCTESGVLKYNGYSIRKFDFNDGLPNIDVWHLHEDHQNRIILSCFSKIPGYIKDDKYHSFAIKGFDSSVQYIAPKYFYFKNDTLWFYNQTSVWHNSGIGYVKGDTIYNIPHPNINEPRNFQAHSNSGLLHFDDKEHHRITKLKIENNKYTDRVPVCNNTPSFMYNYIVNSVMIKNKGKLHLFDVGQKILVHDPSKQKTYYIDFATCKVDSFKLLNKGQQNKNTAKQKIIWDYPYDQYHSGIVTQDSIYIVDTGLNILQFSYEELTGKQNLKGTYGDYAIYDSIWGRGLCTPNNGIYISMGNDNQFKKTSHNFAKNIYLGRDNDSISYWLDKVTQRIIILCNDNIVAHKHINYYKQLLSIKSLSANKKILIETNGTLLYNVNKKESYVPTLKNNTIIYKGVDDDKLDKGFYEELFPSIKSVIIVDSNDLYGVSGTMNGLYHYSFIGSDSLKVEQINNLKFNKISYSKKHDFIIAHNDFEVVLYYIKQKQQHTIPISVLKANGIHQIKKIVTDTFGNIFIQDYDQLLLLDLKKLSFKKILKGYNLEGAHVDVLHDKITIAGSFGVAQCKALGVGRLSNEHIYPNSKGLLYNYVVNMNVSKNIITITTDNGSYFIHTNDITKGDSFTSPQYLLKSYNGKTSRLNKTDTLQLNYENKTFSLDVINPTGYGKLGFNYKLSNNSKWASSNSSNINLQQLSPNHYHTIKIQAFDNIWKSDIVSLHVFIAPRWWQTRYGILTIGLSSILFISVLIYIISITTKKRVQQKNERINKQRDLELKSIYSQINPHFIFNTLSTALFFVKKNQNQAAAKHISQFSELLRAYLKSSRNKYISIAEEVENLDNYLQLQMSRFDEKIQYEIIVDELVDANNITIPSLLLQPIVENSLNHGIFHKAGLGEVKISFKRGRNEKETICIVDDNGIGRKKAKTLRNTTKVDSYGTILIEELIETFNKYEPILIKLEYIDKVEPNTGTTVIITINDKR